MGKLRTLILVVGFLVVSVPAMADEYIVTPLAHYVLDRAGCSCKSIREFSGYAICHIHGRDIKKVEGGNFLTIECKRGAVEIHASHIAEVPH